MSDKNIAIERKEKKKRGSKTTLWKKGVSANPGGVSKKGITLREFRKTSYDDFVNKLQQYGGMTPEEIKEEIKRPDITNFDLMFARVVDGAATGDRYARELLMDRLWGKAKETTMVAFETEHEMMKKIPMADLIDLYKKHNQPQVIDVTVVEKEERL